MKGIWKPMCNPMPGENGGYKDTYIAYRVLDTSKAAYLGNIEFHGEYTADRESVVKLCETLNAAREDTKEKGRAMNITGVKPAGFASGFDFFCPDCGVFFSTQLEPDCIGRAEYCPYCGRRGLIDSAEGLLAHCADRDTDPVNFYEAFPPDEPVPNSRTGATPRQAGRIIDCAANDKQMQFPITIESLAAQLGYNKGLVEKVFEEYEALCPKVQGKTGGAR